MRVLVTGASGFLGAFVAAELQRRGHVVVGTCRQRQASPACAVVHRWDFAASAAAPPALQADRFDAVIHTAAQAGVAACHRDQAMAEAVNVTGTREVAALAARDGAALVVVSSDVVFSGLDVPPGGYGVASAPGPLNAYARTKVAAEAAARTLVPDCAVVRPSLLYRRRDEGTRPAGAEWVVDRVRRGEATTVYTDQIRHPTHAPALAVLLCLLAEGRTSGMFHAGSQRPWRRSDFARLLLRHFGVDDGAVEDATVASAPPPEGLQVPTDLTLDTTSVTAVLGRPFADPADVLADRP